MSHIYTYSCQQYTPRLCEYIYTYVYMYIYMCTCTYICINICVIICIRIYAYIYAFTVCVCVRVCRHPCRQCSASLQDDSPERWGDGDTWEQPREDWWALKAALSANKMIMHITSCFVYHQGPLGLQKLNNYKEPKELSLTSRDTYTRQRWW